MVARLAPILVMRRLGTSPNGHRSMRNGCPAVVEDGVFVRVGVIGWIVHESCYLLLSGNASIFHYTGLGLGWGGS